MFLDLAATEEDHQQVSRLSFWLPAWQLKPPDRVVRQREGLHDAGRQAESDATPNTPVQ